MILDGLRQLHEAAVRARLVVEIAVSGGSALALAYDLREATKDVGAVFHSENVSAARKLIGEIAEKNNWPEDWFNDGVKGFLSANEALIEFEDFVGHANFGLRVFVPTAEYLFAMKCMSMRIGEETSSDIEDIQELAVVCGISSAEEALQLLETFYPAKRIPPKVCFGVEEIFQDAVLRARVQNAKTLV